MSDKQEISSLLCCIVSNPSFVITSFSIYLEKTLLAAPRNRLCTGSTTHISTLA